MKMASPYTYNVTQAPEGMAGQRELALDVSPDMRTIITERIRNNERRIAEDQELLALLDRTPDIERILTLLGKSGRW